jgi:NAD(P)-dependent dehydrogenase (short-subunit alcohol dehydrogenase family)
MEGQKTAYDATKSALIGLTRAMAVDHGSEAESRRILPLTFLLSLASTARSFLTQGTADQKIKSKPLIRLALPFLSTDLGLL